MQKQIVPAPPNHAKGVRINAATSGDAISSHSLSSLRYKQHRLISLKYLQKTDYETLYNCLFLVFINKEK